MEDGRWDGRMRRGIKQAGQKRRKFANFKFDEDVHINRGKKKAAIYKRKET